MLKWCRRLVMAVLVTVAVPSLSQAQPGFYLPGAGAIHAGMAGVSTATPVDALGALYWNPAAIGRLGRNEASIGGSLIYPELSVTSSRPRPLVGDVLSGRTRSDNGFPLVPSLGVVSKLDDDSPLTFGLGMLAFGSGVNYPGDPNNPVLAPTGPFGQVVLGPVFSNMQVIQLNPTVSYQFTDRLVVGAGPTVDITTASFDPAFFAQPNRVILGPNSFPSATNARPYWGGGFRVGAVYSLTDTLDLGFGYTSPQWLETWRFNARDNFGNPQTLSLQASLPAIYSWGVAWRGIERLTLGVDMRYIDYKNAQMFGTPTDLGGLGWEGSFAVAVGGNYQVTDRFAVRAGYQYNTNPLQNTRVLFNLQSPAIIQHVVTVGTTMNLTENLSTSLGYGYGFHNSIVGQFAQAPNTRVQLDAAGHQLLFGLQIKFGKPWGRKACPPCDVSLTAPATAGPVPSPSPGMATVAGPLGGPTTP